MGPEISTGEIIACVLLAITIVELMLLYRKVAKVEDRSDFAGTLAQLKKDIEDGQDDLRADTGRIVRENMASFTDVIGSNTKNMVSLQQTELERIDRHMQEKLDVMRSLVDEKLQKTLNERVTDSFKAVNEHLVEVHKGLGEMQNLARSVGDLKKVMSGVKTRGILGEVALGAILQDVLAPGQYETNAATKKGSADRVEFAVKMPLGEGGFVYLPIDSKFPADTYMRLKEACETGSADDIKAARRDFVRRLRDEAKDISEKYLDPPNTTDFAIMFLPSEGMYLEAVNSGLVEELQRERHVNLAGPATMAAMLNCIQMSLRSIAIQRRSTEVWQVLNAVKTEFATFEKAFEAARGHMDQASKDLDRLVGVRTKKMAQCLKDVGELPTEDTDTLPKN